MTHEHDFKLDLDGKISCSKCGVNDNGGASDMLIISNITIEDIPNIDDTHYDSYAQYANKVNRNMSIGPKKQI